jgi:predicted nucleotidyltransferase
MDAFDFQVDLEACRENFQARQKQRLEDLEAHRLAAHTAIMIALGTVLPFHPEVARIYLFGSVTKPGEFQADSDIDVAVEGTNAEQYFALWHELNDAAPDWVIDLREIDRPSYFADTVRQRGELVYERKNTPVIG